MGAKGVRPATVRADHAAGNAEARRAERVELRTTGDEKRLLVAAAAHEHVDVTAFVLRAALPAAREVVDRASRVQLSARDTARVLELLEHPPEPPARLRRAAEAYRANQAAQQLRPPGRRARRGK